jgi:hypothetical protein
VVIMVRPLLTFAVTLSAMFALAPPARAASAQERPDSCRLLENAQHKCRLGQCDNREIERLRKECLRDDGGRPPSNRGLKDE